MSDVKQVPNEIYFDTYTSRYTLLDPSGELHKFVSLYDAYEFMSKQPTETAQATKYDDGKNRLELIPPEAIFGLGEVLTFGAKKYNDRNWEKGMKWSRVFGAAMRHLWKWWWTKKPDEETGLSHLKHALCCVAFLVAYEERKVGEDDRP